LAAFLDKPADFETRGLVFAKSVLSHAIL